MSRANTKGGPPSWSRRDFVRCGACVVGASCLGLLSVSGSAAGLLQEPLAIDLGDPGYTDLRTVGGAVKIEVDGRELPVMLVRIDEETVIALSTYCTHWGCEVELPDEDGLIICRCQGPLRQAGAPDRRPRPGRSGTDPHPGHVSDRRVTEWLGTGEEGGAPATQPSFWSIVRFRIQIFVLRA